MDWSDEGIVLAARPHSESNAVAELLTRAHGRHLGLVRGGRSRRQRPVLQPGNIVTVGWRARLSEHLGTFAIELVEARAARALDDAAGLAALSTLCALARLLPERDPHAALYDGAALVLRHIGDEALWPGLLVRWELELLNELGFGLDLSCCAATGMQEELVYVSPNSGRAVSRTAGAPYHDRLLALPAFLSNGPPVAPGLRNVLEGFALTGHFLHRHVLAPRGLKMPEARARLIAALRQGLPGDSGA